jgi:hypothetical protein
MHADQRDSVRLSLKLSVAGERGRYLAYIIYR